MKCFYHNDLDGRCAAFWVSLSVGIKDLSLPSELIEINYNIPFPFKKIKAEEQVWIVDYSISPEEMNRLLKITTDITWIDHHKTAIEKYKDFPIKIRGLRKVGLSGCELTYLYIHQLTARGDGCIKKLNNKHIKEIPLFTQFVGDWDCWRFTHGEQRVRHFKTGIEMCKHSYKDNIWFDLLTEKISIDDICKKGSNGLLFQKHLAKKLIKSWSFPVNFEGYNCIALNAGCCNSDYFDSVSEEYDIYITFISDGSKWIVSLYSKNSIDVSKIAKKYDGGGHKGASGFVCSNLPFKLLDKPKSKED